VVSEWQRSSATGAEPTSLWNSGDFNTWSASGVRVYHGLTPLIRIPSLPHSHAKLYTSWFSAAAVGVTEEEDERLAQ